MNIFHKEYSQIYSNIQIFATLWPVVYLKFAFEFISFKLKELPHSSLQCVSKLNVQKCHHPKVCFKLIKTLLCWKISFDEGNVTSKNGRIKDTYILNNMYKFIFRDLPFYCTKEVPENLKHLCCFRHGVKPTSWCLLQKLHKKDKNFRKT